MEHKQVLQPANPYEVIAFLDGPEPNDERLYTYTELERVETELGQFKQANWLKTALRQSDGPSADELKHYRHQLGSYLNTMTRYQTAMAQGIVPIRVVVTNAGQQTGRNIQIEVHLHDGTFLLTRQVPARPLRPIGPQRLTEDSGFTPADVVSGFLRTDIKLGRTKLSAKFSELNSGDEAAVVNQTVFLHCKPETRMTYRLVVDNAAEYVGDINL